ncbi:DUF1189 family protein [Carnobacteriaceae bacterium zg-ZUI252]|nr:DUF1189 family protein [Carnobacteriaceae bacterium zg-ZUI252]MBS4770010.1 DUF1189 family protein [Carnobacteriaceae bacterium zg-ZUI240]
MLHILLKSIHQPEILTHVTLLRKHIIVKLTLLLSCVVALPTLIEQYSVANTLNNNLSTVAQNLPQFTTTEQKIIKTFDSTNASEAIQTEHVYYAFDSNQTLSSNQIQNLIDDYTMTIITQNNETNYYLLGKLFFKQTISSEAVSTHQLQETLSLLQNGISVSYFIIPIFSILFSVIIVLTQNLILTLAARFIFLLSQKIVRFQHLWRVSLFASFGPYVIVTIAKLLNLTLPFELFVFFYVLFIQHTVLKIALTQK